MSPLYRQASRLKFTFTDQDIAIDVFVAAQNLEEMKVSLRIHDDGGPAYYTKIEIVKIKSKICSLVVFHFFYSPSDNSSDQVFV